MAKKINKALLPSEPIRDNVNALNLAEKVAKESEEIRKSQELGKRSPYKRWVQIDQDNITALLCMEQEQPNALSILLYILQNMDGCNALVCSYTVMQEQFGLSRSTVSRCIKYLKDNGYLYVYKSGTSNVYVANPAVAWKSYGKNQKYCKFPANVILARSEQDRTQTTKDRITVIYGKTEVTNEQED